jgi:hypothetical protein
MFTPLEPKAGPTGGAGFACSAFNLVALLSLLFLLPFYDTFSTCTKLTSTGVLLPNIFTITFNFFFSS